LNPDGTVIANNQIMTLFIRLRRNAPCGSAGSVTHHQELVFMTEEEQNSTDLLERRVFVRESFFFKVKFQRLTEAEYQRVREKWAERLSFDRKILKLEDFDADTNHGAPPLDPHLLDFLLQMDDKLDQLIAHLTGEGKRDGRMEEGEGVDLGGGGMKIKLENPLSVGQLLQADLLLSRLPFVRVHIFGEVLHVNTRFMGEGACWEVGVRFLDLDSEDRERIIACVFQRQREALRKRKGKESTHEEVIEIDE